MEIKPNDLCVVVSASGRDPNRDRFVTAVRFMGVFREGDIAEHGGKVWKFFNPSPSGFWWCVAPRPLQFMNKDRTALIARDAGPIATSMLRPIRPGGEDIGVPTDVWEAYTAPVPATQAP